MCPDVVKKLNVKVFNLMSRTNETRFIEWHETCKCECKFWANACKNKQRWNKDKCRCECKELIKGVCDKVCELKGCVIKDLFGILVIVIVNVIKCDVGKYLDYENCKCRKKLVAPLTEECTETVEEVKLAKKLLLKMKIVINVLLACLILCR